MSILVTGAAGFIGYHVCTALLQRGESVLGVDNMDGRLYGTRLKKFRQDRLLEWPDFTAYRADVADEAFTAHPNMDFKAVIHLAAHAGIRSPVPPDEVARSNVVGFTNVMEYARRYDLPVIYASSSSVYGASAAVNQAPRRKLEYPMSLYAATKRADELIAEAYAHQFNLPIIGLRFFTVYGTWGRPDMVVWKFAESILRGEPVKLHANGYRFRDFTHVSDAVQGVLATLEMVDNPERQPGRRQRIYDIGTERQTGVRQLAEKLGAALGVTPTIVNSGVAPMSDVPSTLANLEYAVDDLRYCPRMSLDDGLAEFAAWLRKYREETSNG